MRKELEFPQMDESKIQAAGRLIDIITGNYSGDNSKELSELKKFSGKDHSETEFAQYWGLYNVW